LTFVYSANVPNFFEDVEYSEKFKGQKSKIKVQKIKKPRAEKPRLEKFFLFQNQLFSGLFNVVASRYNSPQKLK
jgi:hypothetical protein